MIFHPICHDNLSIATYFLDLPTFFDEAIEGLPTMVVKNSNRDWKTSRDGKNSTSKGINWVEFLVNVFSSDSSGGHSL